MFDWITGIIRQLGYTGVGMLTFLENVFPPIPSELVIPLAGFIAAEGELHLGVVIATATLGSLAGAALWYEVGRRVGEAKLREWIDRHGRWLTLSGADIDRAQAWFTRHGKSAVLIGRLRGCAPWCRCRPVSAECRADRSWPFPPWVRLSGLPRWHGPASPSAETSRGLAITPTSSPTACSSFSASWWFDDT